MGAATKTNPESLGMKVMFATTIAFVIVFLAGMLGGVNVVQWHAKQSDTIKISGDKFQKVTEDKEAK